MTRRSRGKGPSSVIGGGPLVVKAVGLEETPGFEETPSCPHHFPA